MLVTCWGALEMNGTGGSQRSAPDAGCPNRYILLVSVKKEHNIWTYNAFERQNCQ